MTNFIPTPKEAFTFSGSDGKQYVNRSWYLFLNQLFNISGGTSGVVPVSSGGTGIPAGVAGGVLAFTDATTLVSTAMLTANALMLGGGVGVPSTPLGLGTSVQVLHGNAVGAPTWGAVALATQVSGLLPLANGGTAASLTASNGGIVYSNATTLAVLGGTATAGQMLRSGSSITPSWSTPTWPNTATLNKALIGDGTNIVLSTPTIPLSSSPSSGVMMRGDGTNWTASTATWPNTITSNQVLYGTGTNAVGQNSGLTFDGTRLTVAGPVKLSGGLLGSPEATSVEYSADKFYGTITTGAARKEFTLNDGSLTSGRIPAATTNGRLTDGPSPAVDGTYASPVSITINKGLITAIS